jgi:cbb3-type cytochrome oxidase subunit 3
MSLTCANANNLLGWVFFFCFKRKKKGQYDEEALIG